MGTSIFGMMEGNRSAPSGQSAGDRLYEDLRRRIISLELLPDATLSRGEIAKHYEVSHTPVREAVQRLAQDGLVKIYPQSRTVVTRIDIPQLHESHFLRVALEVEVVRQLAEKKDSPAIARAHTLLQMQEALSCQISELETFQDLDEAFHQTLFAGVNQAGLHGLLKARSGHLARIRCLDLPEEGKMRSIIQAHRSILGAIEKGNRDLAQREMRKHLSGTISRIEELRKEHPDYFSEKRG